MLSESPEGDEMKTANGQFVGAGGTRRAEKEPNPRRISGQAPTLPSEHLSGTARVSTRRARVCAGNGVLTQTQQQLTECSAHEREAATRSRPGPPEAALQRRVGLSGRWRERLCFKDDHA